MKYEDDVYTHKKEAAKEGSYVQLLNGIRQGTQAPYYKRAI